jgi:hypothetical protein
LRSYGCDAAGGAEWRHWAPAAARQGKRVNAFPASVLSAGCTGRLRPLWETHLEARGAAEATGDDGGSIASTGKQGRGREAAGEHPHRNAKLMERLLEGGERWSGGAPSGPSTAMAAAEELGA